jgi:crotonobetainyl-CoA:carnitine CoA-transferase CaiB-like acyl-CoA transferase
MPDAGLALDAVTVVEHGDGVPVRYCGRLLHQLGARVIRVEDPEAGRPVKDTGGSSRSFDERVPAALTAYLDAGKESVCLNLGSKTGREILGKLCAKADVLLLAARRGEITALGVPIEGEALRQAARVVVSLTPWGSEAPRAMDSATDLLLYHGGGLGSITPRFANNPEEPPLRMGYPIAEFVAGLNAAVSTLAGLEHLQLTGEGSLVEVSGQQAIAYAMGMYSAYPSYEGRAVSRVSRPELAPYHFLPCKDGWVMVICPEQHQWDSLVALMGHPAWAEGELFNSSRSRAEYWDAIEPQLMEWTATMTRDELYHAAQARRIPLAPVSTMDAVLASRQLAERGFLVDVDVAGIPVAMPGMSFRSDPPLASPASRAPNRGEHTRAVLQREAGLSPDELDAMRRNGIT